MKIFERIKQNKKAIFIAFILIFNIPLAFGLVSKLSAASTGYLPESAYEPVINSPADQNFFNITSTTTAKLSYNCEASLGTGGGFTLVRSLVRSTGGVDFETLGCKYLNGGYTAVADYLNHNEGGFVNMVSNVQATILEQRPMSASYYAEQKIYALANAGNVYAAGDLGTAPAPYFPSGTGFQLLQPIQAFWGWSVNIVYGFLILIIIGIAFAIVFRNNIGGAQMVTIQSAIPSIALAMILVPLSYAISGVFIDAITVGTNVVHAFLLGPGSPGQKVYDERNVGKTDCQNTTSDSECDRGLYADDSRVSWFNVRNMINISDPVTEAASDVNVGGTTVNNFFIFDIVKTILNLFSGKGESSAYWFGEIINLIINLTMIWIGLKILWKLLQKYFMLILMPIISPFIFATAAIPGNGTKSIVEYVKTMASGSLFYIVTYAMFLLTIIFTSSSFQSQVPDIQSGAFVPPLIGFKDIFVNTGALGSTSLTHFIFTLVGLGIYFSIPKTLEGIDAALGVSNAIPKFILTPWESFKESAKITYRAAPAFGVKATKSVTENVSNIAAGAWRGNLTRRDLVDKLRGKTPGQEGSYRYNLTRQFAEQRFQIQNRLKTAQEAGDLGGIARGNADLAVLNTRERAIGINTQAEADKPRTISVKFDWRGNSTLNFDSSEIATFFTQAGLSPTGRYRPGAAGKSVLVGNAGAAPGKIILEAQNFEFPEFVNLSDIVIGDVAPYAGSGGKEGFKNDTGLRFVSTTSGVPVTGIPDTSFALGKIVGGASDKAGSGLDSFRLMQGDFKSPRAGTVPTKGNVIEIPIYIEILDVVSMFGSYDTRQNNYVGDPATNFVPQLTTAGELLTTKRAYKFSNYESTPTRVIIKRTGR